MSSRCHWWSADWQMWFAWYRLPKSMNREAHTTANVKPGDPCPYCGATLPPEGPEEAEGE